MARAIDIALKLLLMKTTARLFALQDHPERLLWVVMLWHVSFWVLAPALFYRMLPLDTLELLGWGQEWQWGYYKHPPLGAWLGEIALQLGAGHLASLYLLAQACLLITLFYVWRTARLFLDPTRAVLATVLLEGSYFHTFLIPNFNMNSLQLPIWAGLCFHFLKALRGEPAHWLAWGVFVALAMLSKYSGALLIATCGCILIATAEGRRAFREPALWLGAALALLILTPHLLWLANHAALPLSYLQSFNTEQLPALRGHVLEPLRFAVGSLLGLLFCGLLFLTVREPGQKTHSQALALVLALCLGPLLLSMAYGVVSGSRLKSTWAFPFFNLAGVALFLWLPTRIDAQHLRRFLAALIGVMLLIATVHVVYKTRSDESKTAFDGEALATHVADAWRDEFRQPLRIVVGDHILTAIVSSYAPTRPSMLIQGDFGLSLWLTPDDMRRDGAAVVCREVDACYPDLLHPNVEMRSVEISGQRFRYFFIAPQS